MNGNNLEKCVLFRQNVKIVNCNFIRSFFQGGKDKCCGGTGYSPTTQICCGEDGLFDMAKVRSASFLPNNRESTSTYCNIKHTNINYTRAILFLDVALFFDHDQAICNNMTMRN